MFGKTKKLKQTISELQFMLSEKNKELEQLKKMPELSVIIPVYNTAAYLRRCLDSVINQTMRDIEIILASDGPEDCDAICREYAAEDSRIKLIERRGAMEQPSTGE